MSNVIGIFLAVFVSLLVVLVAEVYNIFTLGKLFSFKTAIMLFSSYFIPWLILFVMFLAEPEEIIFLTLFQLSNLFMVVHVFFFIVEALFLLVNIGDDVGKAYNSKEARQKEANFSNTSKSAAGLYKG